MEKDNNLYTVEGKTTTNTNALDIMELYENGKHRLQQELADLNISDEQ